MIHDIINPTPESDNKIIFSQNLNTDNYDILSEYLDYVNINKNPDKAFALMMLLGGWIYKSGKSNSKFFQSSPTHFYNQLVNRCFNDIQGKDKEFFEKYMDIFKSKTTQRACIIYAIVTRNIIDYRKRKLNNMAKNLFYAKANTDISLLREIDTKASKITKIIKPTLDLNPELQSIMYEVYNGKFPSTFVISNNKNQTR